MHSVGVPLICKQSFGPLGFKVMEEMLTDWHTLTFIIIDVIITYNSELNIHYDPILTNPANGSCQHNSTGRCMVTWPYSLEIHKKATAGLFAVTTNQFLIQLWCLREGCPFESPPMLTRLPAPKFWTWKVSLLDGYLLTYLSPDVSSLEDSTLYVLLKGSFSRGDVL